MSFVLGWTYDIFSNYYRHYMGSNVEEDIEDIYITYKKQKNELLLNEIIEDIKKEQQLEKKSKTYLNNISQSVYM